MAALSAIAAERESFQAALFRYVAAERPEVVALEWSAKIRCEAGTTEPGCPRCGSLHRNGHAAGCRLGAIIRAVR